jgi:alpha-L-rhamnosidase
LESQSKDGIVLYSYYGDWASPIAGNDANSYGSGAVSAITPGKLMSTGYLYYNATLMRKIGKILEKEEDVTYYDKLAQKTQNALNRVFLNREKGFYGTNSQAANCFMLYLGLVPDEYRAVVVENLVNDIRAHETHLTTGNLCSRYIFDVLCDNGYIDLAYELLIRRDYPSWGYMLSKGATTAWERWEFVESGPLIGMASHDHPMYASISGWFYAYLLGIQPELPGFASFTFQPYVPTQLESAGGIIKTVRGDIRAGWKQKNGSTQFIVDVPFNSQCRLILPPCSSVMVNGKSQIPEIFQRNSCVTLSPGKYEIINNQQ